MSPDDTRASRDDADEPPPCYPCLRMSSRLTWVLVTAFAVGCGASAPAAPTPVPATRPTAPPSAIEVTKAPRGSVIVTGVSRQPVPGVVQPPAAHPDWKQVPSGNWVAWATFLNAVHNRLHHSVADEYLVGTLGKAPKDDPRNTPTLEVAFELDFDANGAIEIRGASHLGRRGVRPRGGRRHHAIGAVPDSSARAPFARWSRVCALDDAKRHGVCVQHDQRTAAAVCGGAGSVSARARASRRRRAAARGRRRSRKR